MAKESDKLRERILEDGRKKAEPVKRRAQRKADEIVQDAREEAKERREQMRHEAEEEAELEAQRILARAELEAENVRRQAREAVLQQARQVARTRLRELADSDDHLQCLARLAVHSLRAMEGDQFELVLPAEEKEQRCDEVLETVKQRAAEELDRDLDLNVADERISCTGGLWVRRPDGHEICDQTFEARLDRLWPQIRAEIADELLESLECLSQESPQPNPQESDEQTSQEGSDE
jgi:vacuolar-type H+-ATPase subunit E/Vma4